SDPDYNNDYSGTSPDPDLSDYTPVADPDQDIITEQVYDPNGNLVQSIDPLGNVALTVYDALNRPVSTVRNNVAQGNHVTDPVYWVWNATSGCWEYCDTDISPITHVADNDHYLIQDTVYDALCRVVYNLAVDGIIARSAYDSL